MTHLTIYRDTCENLLLPFLCTCSLLLVLRDVYNPHSKITYTLKGEGVPKSVVKHARGRGRWAPQRTYVR